MTMNTGLQPLICDWSAQIVAVFGLAPGRKIRLLKNVADSK